MRKRMSRIVARVATVVLLIIAMVVIGQRTADQDNEQDNFGALLTSDWQPKVAAGVLAR
jgi:hypothetical protein